MLNLTQDLFLDLATTDDQLDFPVIYTIAKQGTATLDPDPNSVFVFALAIGGAASSAAPARATVVRVLRPLWRLVSAHSDM